MLVALASGGCKPYRVETHHRPEFFQKAAKYELPDEFIEEDGTVVRYASSSAQSSFGRKGDEAGKPFELREQAADGTVQLNNALPEHVLINTLNCLKSQEYQLLWDEMVAQHTKDNYELEGKGFEEFQAFFAKERHELVGMLTRMVAGMPHQEVRFDELDHGVTRCIIRPQFAGLYKYKMVFVMKEGSELKLGMIK